jgi:UDP-2,4-diacetamido-2,4,6-trideoxy-beta-L-altropyranose hydrolase
MQDDLGLYLREAEPGDCRWLWTLANDPVVRATSFSEEQIEWATHVEWFDRAIESPTRRIFVAENAAGDFVGQIRFDLERKEAIVSVEIVPSKRGGGLGAALIRAGTRRCLDEVPSLTVVHAFIKTSNEVSVGAFTKANYHAAGLTKIRGHEAYDMVFQRNSEE